MSSWPEALAGWHQALGKEVANVERYTFFRIIFRCEELEISIMVIDNIRSRDDVIYLECIGGAKLPTISFTPSFSKVLPDCFIVGTEELIRSMSLSVSVSSGSIDRHSVSVYRASRLLMLQRMRPTQLFNVRPLAVFSGLLFYVLDVILPPLPMTGLNFLFIVLPVTLCLKVFTDLTIRDMSVFARTILRERIDRLFDTAFSAFFHNRTPQNPYGKGLIA